MLDKVLIVNAMDEIIGQMDKIEAHRGEGVLHRAISVLLFRTINGQQELLIQQRSDKKIVGAGQWANTCCGNVRPGESYEECAQRRLKEELGIENVELQPHCKFEYQVRCNAEFSEHEIDQVFVGWFDGNILPNPDEVKAIEWLRWNKENPMQVLQFRKQAEWAPWFEIVCRNY